MKSSRSSTFTRAPVLGSGGVSISILPSGRSRAAYVFVRSGETWSLQGFLKAGEPRMEDHFGMSVAVSGTTIVVGSHYEDGDGSSESDDSARDSGAVYVFEPMDGAWEQSAYLKAWNAGPSDHFGASVGILGDTIVVGAETEASDGSSWADDSMPGAGAVYLFFRRDAGWVQGPYLKAFNPAIFDKFGAAVAIAEGAIVVGAVWEASDGSSPDDNSLDYAGAGYVFR